MDLKRLRANIERKHQIVRGILIMDKTRNGDVAGIDASQIYGMYNKFCYFIIMKFFLLKHIFLQMNTSQLQEKNWREQEWKHGGNYA